jgi:hypothetical protein
MFKRGAKVDADFGSGYQIAFVLSGPEGPEDKYTLQSPANGEPIKGFAYRETGDVGDGPSGLTFKKL